MPDSSITKQALASSLKKLMQSESFNNIKIADICDGCKLNRKSFYYHFRDKYDLLNWIFDTEFSAISSSPQCNSTWELFTSMFQYFYDNRDFYHKAMKTTGQNSFSDHFHQKLFGFYQSQTQQLVTDTQYRDIQANFFADALYCATQRWLMDKKPIPPKEFASSLKVCFNSFYVSMASINAGLNKK